MVVSWCVPEKVDECLCWFLVAPKLLGRVTTVKHEHQACCKLQKLIWLQLVDDQVAPAEHVRYYLVNHVAKYEGVLISQLVNQVGKQASDINLAELFEELGGQVSQVDEPLGNVLIHVQS